MNERVILCTEELVEVKFVKLSLGGNLADALRHLVGQHHHFGQLGVRIALTFPSLFGCLLVRISPVVDLFLDKLSRSNGTEGCT